MNNIVKLLVLGGTILATSSVVAQSARKTPYWASIEEAEARMRTGPSTEYPVKWVYKRQNLPVKVISTHEVWRKVEDPDGDQGWMHVRLLSPNRTAIVTATGVSELRDAPEATSRISWRVEKGVVGKIDDCQKGWCRLDIAGRVGYIEADRIWGEEAP
jgi:SH3-like domain-containing protein